jgi:hypothetical protein
MASHPKPSPRTICNPAWDIWARAAGHDPGDRLRPLVSHSMAFAIPSPLHLAEVARHGPLVEVGAGTGYWAWCLRQLGVDIVAYDRFPPQTHPARPDQWRGALAAGGQRNAWFDCYWTQVIRGGATAAARHPDRTLLLVWPYGAMAHRALEAYRGGRVIFVGEWDTPTVNDPPFFRRLERGWRRLRVMPAPQWPGTRSELIVLQRDPP